MNHDFSLQTWDLEALLPGKIQAPRVVYRCRKCGIVGDLSPQMVWTVEHETCEEVITAKIMES